MTRYFGVLAILPLVVVNPAPAHARGYGGRGGTVMTPFGPVYNTNSPEWRQSGGNPMVYQQIMEQKAFMQQQQLLVKQQQQMIRMQQQQNKGLKGQPPANPGSFLNAQTPPPHRKKNKRTYDPSHPVTSGSARSAADSRAAAGKPDPPKTADKP